jgi:hypothetical protein
MWFVIPYTDILPLRMVQYLESDMSDEFGKKARRLDELIKAVIGDEATRPEDPCEDQGGAR